MSNAIYNKIGEYKVVPVIAIDDVDKALPLADVLIESGLPIAEITFRTAAAEKVIEILKKERPQLFIGAGTILNIEDLRKAKNCGAEFGVAPGFNPVIVQEALKLKFPFSPGIMTPSDIEGALTLGIHVLKYFPAEAAGGLKYLNSIYGPYAHTGVRFMPSGGINKNNAADYISSKAVLAIGGTWIATRTDISTGNWKSIKSNCREILSILRE